MFLHVTRKRLLVNIFLTCILSKSLAFCEFASLNFEPCLTEEIGISWEGDRRFFKTKKFKEMYKA